MGDLGNKEIMAKNIKYYMSRNNIRPTDICGTLKFPMATFSDWINAKTYPRIDKIELMANYFGIEKSDLVEEKRVRIKKGVTINVLGRVAAGIPLEAIENIIDTEEITEELAKTGNFFGVTGFRRAGRRRSSPRRRPLTSTAPSVKFRRRSVRIPKWT